MRPLASLIATLFLLLCGLAQAGERIALRVVTLPQDRHLYYTRLLEESLRAAGYEPELIFVKDVPEPRLWGMVAQDQLSLIWGVQTSARDHDYASIKNALTNGLIGQRILLVKAGHAGDYAQVRTLDDFRKLGKVGSVGVNWFEAEVWNFNLLPLYIKTGDWRRLFSMVENGDRGIDYVVRGAGEIAKEAAEYPGLAIEPHLILSYERDMHFYLSPGAVRYKSIIENALAQADRSGLKKKLMAQYLLPELKNLNLDKRVALKLATPPY